jgi:hypothetical protein
MSRFLAKSAVSIFTVAAGLVGFSSASVAQVAPGKWSISIAGGADEAIDGTMHGGANAPVADLGALNPALSGIPATLQIGSRSQNKVYDTALTFGGEIGYGLSETGEALLAVRYLKANGNRINVGSAAAGAPVNASLPVLGDFGDYKSLSVELGYRKYLKSGEGLTPFVAARAGLARVSSISADFSVPDAGIALNNVPFSKSSWEFTGGLELGVSIPIGANFRIEPEVGVRYTSGAKGNDTALGGLGLGSINNKGERWSIPARIRLKVAM